MRPELAARRVGIVGGSLGGLAMANALARVGAEVVVFERGASGFETRGGGLGLDPSSATRLLGDLPPHLVLTERRVWAGGREVREPTSLPVTAYGAMWRWMRAGLAGTGAALRQATLVTALEPGPDDISVIDARGERTTFDLVVAADGGTSNLRASLADAGATRRYAGYVLWRGIVPAAALAADDPLKTAFHIATDPAHHFVAYPIPTPDGARDVAARNLNWGWYFPLRESAMQALYDAELTDAPHAIGRLHLPPLWAGTLAGDAQQRWPAWARRLVELSLAQGLLAPHPIFSWLPNRLAAPRFVCTGDAAHLASPITGAGARMATEDALTLAAALQGAAGLQAALENYEQTRLPVVRALVQQGRDAGARFAARE